MNEMHVTIQQLDEVFSGEGVDTDCREDLPVLEEDKDMMLSFSETARTTLALAIQLQLKPIPLLLGFFFLWNLTDATKIRK
jgi:hypothetical protein